MTLKWIGRIFYVILVLFAALYVVQVGFVSRNNAFFVSEVQDNWDDTETFLEGVATLQLLDYFQETPIYSYSGDENDNSFDLNIYAVGTTYNEEFYDGFLILVNNVEIYENGNLVENPIIKITANVSEDTILIEEEYQAQGSVVYDPTNESFYGNAPILMLFDVDGNLINENGTDDENDDVFSTLERITVDYSNRDLDDDGAYLFNADLNDEVLFIAQRDAVTDNALFEDTLVFEASDYQLSKQFSDGTLSDDDVTALGLNTNTGNLSDYNWEIYKSAGIYVLIVILLTYFIFFHKKVMEKMRAKKSSQSDTVELKVEPIFKDSEPTNEKDGK